MMTIVVPTWMFYLLAAALGFWAGQQLFTFISRVRLYNMLGRAKALCPTCSSERGDSDET